MTFAVFDNTLRKHTLLVLGLFAVYQHAYAVRERRDA